MKLLKILLSISLISLNISAVAADCKVKNQSMNLNELINVNKVDVEAELKKTLEEYRNDCLKSNDKNQIDKLNSLIEACEKLINDYSNEESVSTCANQPNAAVSMVVAYFSNKNYYLSRELLLHSTMNTNKKSTYVPNYGYVLKSTNAIKKIAKGTSIKGSSVFNSTSTTAEGDAKYSIHKFDFTKTKANSKTVKVSDYYDYGSGDYDGLAGIAVEAMKNAQKNGSIVPFKVSITVSV